jgi:hypothetical protein
MFLRPLYSAKGLSLVEMLIATLIATSSLFIAGRTLIYLFKLKDAAVHYVLFQKTIVTLAKFSQTEGNEAMWNEPDPDIRDSMHPCNKLTSLIQIPEASGAGPYPRILFQYDKNNPQNFLLGGKRLIGIGTQQGDAEMIQFIQLGARLSHHPAFIPTILHIRSASINSLSVARDYEIPIIFELDTTVTPAVTKKCESVRYTVEQFEACRSMDMTWDPNTEECKL